MDDKVSYSVKKKRLKPALGYQQKLITALEQLNALVTDSDHYAGYQNRQKAQLLRLNKLKIANEITHGEIIRNNPVYKKLFEKFPNWQNPQKEQQYQLKTARIAQGVEKLLGELTSGETDKLLSDFFQDKTKSNTPERDKPSTSNAAQESEPACCYRHKKFRAILKKI
ncbi:MAG: hypothetical protein RLZZ225_1219 [Pseudomonadota bacterium]|jgi:hypothetical protein